MDSLAKLAARKSPDAKLIRPIYCSTFMGAYDENNMLIANIHKHILLASTYKELYKYLQNKHEWTDTQMKLIAWTNLEQALNKYRPYQQTKMAQLMHH